MKPLDHAVTTATKPESRVEMKLPLTKETPAGQTDRSTTEPVDDSPYPVVGQVYDFMLPRAAREPDTSHGVILYLENLTVSFDGFRAIDDLSLYIDRGELRCIIGPNGAGKTTLMDIVTGKAGQRQRLLRPYRRPAAALGAGDRPGRHRAQVPEADGVRTAHRVREPRAGDGRRAPRLAAADREAQWRAA
jgi:hypothetical protein